jgi:predicted O-linked N-acetylglucosamine transferase (SPINDLY family)
MFAAALKHHQAGRLNDAELLYRQILQADSRHADALHLLGVLAHQIGRHDAAVDLISKAIEQNGQVPAFHNNLGNALKAQGQFEPAAASYQRALSYKPDYVEAHYNLGVALQEQGRLEEAAASYRRALSHKPAHAEAHGNLGNILQAQGKLDQALACYGRALMLKPDYAEAHSNLGNVLRAQGKLDQALACYRRALALKPDYAEALNNLGIVLLEQGKLDEAVAAFGRALFHKPHYPEAHTNLGNALKEQGNADEAAVGYRRALSLNPDYAEARLDLAIAVIPVFADSVAESIGASEKFTRSLDELAAWSTANSGKLGKSVGSNQPFYLAYRPFDVTALLSRYGDLVCAAAADHWRPEPGNDRAVQSRRDRIRIAVVSGQVRRHPVWDVVLRGIVEHIDRRQFEIFLYHTGSIADQETAWASARVDRFVQGPKSTQGWLDESRQDRPDVMFYPEVGMDPATCALAALRLAPLQVASWGHPVTTGLPSMDLFLSARLLEPPGAQQHYREQLVRLPGTGVCTDTTALQARPWGGPERQQDVVRFALCQQPIKFDPADDVLLTRIAKAVGPSEFWLASPTKLHWATARLRDRLAAAFRAEGLDPDAYLRVMPWLARDHFLGFLDAMDVYLDCPAFSGYTTAWQAVHRGLPIVTLEGEFLRQRLAAGLLRQIGVIDGIAPSRDHYVEIAVRWAQQCRQPEQWAARREAIRRAAPAADGNRAAVDAFGQTLIEALQANKSSIDHPQ